MDGLKFACFRNGTSSTGRDTAACVTVHLLLIQSFALKSQSVFVALIAVQLELAKNILVNKPNNENFRETEIFVCRVKSGECFQLAKQGRKVFLK